MVYPRLLVGSTALIMAKNGTHNAEAPVVTTPPHLEHPSELTAHNESKPLHETINSSPYPENA